MSGRAARGRRPGPRALLPAAAVLVLAVLALGPAVVGRGYVLVGDMTFVPHQPWKSTWLGLDGSVPRAVPADAIVSVVGQVVPGDLVQKAVLLGALALAGIGVLRLTARTTVAAPARLGGAVLYLWNPFVYERLAIGHWGLLVGYAVLPWVLAAALDVRRGAPRAQARMLLLLLVAAVGSPTGGLAAALLVTAVVADRRRPRRTAVAVASGVVVNLPWLTPALVNHAAPSDASGVAAFAARSDTPFGVVGSLLTFGGLWKANAVPPERGTVLLAGLALVVVVGSVAALALDARTGKGRERLATGRLLVVAVVGLLLAVAPATGAGERLVSNLIEAVPGAGLWRDSQKWLMPFVLVASIGFTLLLDALADWLHRRGLPVRLVAGGLALLPVVLLPSLLWGLSGRLDPVSYPGEWMTVRHVLDDQPATDRRIAVLPWSAYQRLPWNDRRAALDPAPRYFPGQVVANTDLVVSDRLRVAGDDPSSRAIGRAVVGGADLGPALAGAGVRYLLVERTASGAGGLRLPQGTVLHRGPELLLLDLGGRGEVTRSPHPNLILAADAATAASALVGAWVVIRRKPKRRSGTMHVGAV